MRSGQNNNGSEKVECPHHTYSPFKTAFPCLAVQFGLSLDYTTAYFSDAIIDALRQMGVLGFLLLEDSQPTGQSTIDTSGCTIVTIWNQQHSLFSITLPQAVALLAVCPDKPNFEATSATAHNVTPYHNLESSLAGPGVQKGYAWREAFTALERILHGGCEMTVVQCTLTSMKPQQLLFQN